MNVDADREAMEATEVEIFGQTYTARGHDDEEYLRELAALVDRKMREVAEHVADPDPRRVAILAALNIADELIKSQDREAGERVEIKQRVTALTGELKAALGR